MWVLGVMDAFWLGGLDGFFCCFWGSGFVITLLYTACVCRGGLRFFNKLQPYLLEKKEKEKEKKLIKEKRKGKNGNIALQMAEILMILWKARLIL